MACRNAYKIKTWGIDYSINTKDLKNQKSEDDKKLHQFLFGVDSLTRADIVLQNNLTEFEWVKRNKLYPVFWGRNIVGDNALTLDEINFIHRKGTLVAPIVYCPSKADLEHQGIEAAESFVTVVQSLRIPRGIAIFLEIPEEANVSCAFIKGYAKGMLINGFVPGFKANTDAQFSFDREFSRGMQNHREIFEQCLVWAVAPTIEEYERMTTSHLLHPDEWKPFAPSGIKRSEIAIWQYGKECHPILDDNDQETSFNLNLVRNEIIIKEKMY